MKKIFFTIMPIIIALLITIGSGIGMGYIIFSNSNKEVVCAPNENLANECENCQNSENNENNLPEENNNSSNNNDSNDSNNNIGSPTIDGLFEIVPETSEDKTEDGYISEYYYFNDNGLFHYEDDTFAEWGRYGNYIIENNEIKLNYLFTHGSGYPGLESANDKNITIYLVDENTIKLSDGTTFKKSEDSRDKEDIKEDILGNFNDLIKSYINLLHN